MTERQRQMHERINARAATPTPPMCEGEMVDVGGVWMYVPAGFVVIHTEMDGMPTIMAVKATRH